jgi:magnesium chelatase family protein
VNLAPTNLRKVGSGLDLAIAVAFLAASEQIDLELLRGLAFVGELGLDGAVHHVLGVLPVCEALDGARPVVPIDDLSEAALVRPDALGATDLRQLVRSLEGAEPWPEAGDRRRPGAPARPEPDLADVQGHAVGRRALEVAAAGGHHLLMVGPPGAGKTMLAERLPGLLPDLDEHGALDVSRVHSAAGALHDRPELLRRPPFRSPHHTASLVALVGGGSAVLRPGEISLASGGVLFLDELGEFPASHLDALRQPLESGEIRVARAAVGASLPARFLLVAATNPCPCGAGPLGRCRCSPGQVARYLRRLSGPLLDRFDLGLWIEPPDASEVFGNVTAGESSAVARERVSAARERARSRGVAMNRRLSGDALEQWAPLTDAAVALLRDRIDRGLLTMRGAQRVRAVALTLLDLDERSGPIGPEHLHGALTLRSQDDVMRAVA